MSGRVFLLEVEDKLLYNSLKDSGWSYLKEVFYEVQPWKKTFRVPERVTWIELIGIQLYCWNHHTFKNIAELWGEMLALGENAFQSFGVERMTILISTRQLEKINSVVQLEAGKEQFLVRISELSTYAEQPSNGKDKSPPFDKALSLSSSSSSSGKNSDQVGLSALEISVILIQIAWEMKLLPPSIPKMRTSTDTYERRRCRANQDANPRGLKWWQKIIRANALFRGLLNLKIMTKL
ncbi:hypothetical protein V6N13_024837 [Hibiscus sabdariffa]